MAMATARLTAVLAVMAVLAPTGHAAAAPNLQCKTTFETGIAPGQPSISLGQHIAREAWIFTVRAKFGRVWAETFLARNVTQKCTPQPTGLGATVFVCHYRAQPCKL
jgi:hypothetical protein